MSRLSFLLQCASELTEGFLPRHSKARIIWPTSINHLLPSLKIFIFFLFIADKQKDCPAGWSKLFPDVNRPSYELDDWKGFFHFSSSQQWEHSLYLSHITRQMCRNFSTSVMWKILRFFPMTNVEKLINICHLLHHYQINNVYHLRCFVAIYAVLLQFTMFRHKTSFVPKLCMRRK